MRQKVISEWEASRTRQSPTSAITPKQLIKEAHATIDMDDQLDTSDPEMQMLIDQPSPGSGRVRKSFVEDEVLTIPFKYVVYYCCSLPLFGFILCVLTAIYLHFDGSTRTHCGVSNYLPSISAAIGDYTPERYIWRVCIALHCAPRLFCGFIYRNYYNTSPLRFGAEMFTLRLLGHVLAWLHVAENMMLLLLTCVSSSENHGLHAVAFTLFIVFSMCYMMLNIYLYHYSGRRRSFTNGELSFQYKLLTFLISMCSMLLSVYFYYRHNTHCEPGVYTLFALSEYAVVGSNIAYHGTMVMDLQDKKVSVCALHSLDNLLTTTSQAKDT